MRSVISMMWCLSFAAGTGLASGLGAQATPTGLLDRAIRAAGGAENLARFPALQWRAHATVHVPGRDISLIGLWRIAPPDSAVVATYEKSVGPSSTRRLILAGDRGWSERDGNTEPLPLAVVTEERGQFYLYDLIRLLPLRDHEVQLYRASPDSAGHEGLKVLRPGRQEATLYFGSDDRLVRIRTMLAPVADAPPMAEELTLSGTMQAGGLRWFRRLSITRDGQPFFEMELTSFEPLPRLGDSRLAGPP